ncbi:MAG: hypothetical protein ABIF89_02260 [bacterium]
MELTERQKLILEKILDEYIEKAMPVSSQSLEKCYDFGICPAMIRIEMERLTDQGYLYQPFVSSGRVPTDEGYRFLVDKIMEERIPEFKGINKVGKMLAAKEGDLLKFVSEMVGFLAQASSGVALFRFLDNDLSFKGGWEEVIKEPEFEDRSLIFHFSDFVKNLEESIDKLDFDSDSDMKVFIGKESPFKKGEDFSTISVRFRIPKEKETIISIVGPKRMAYERNISLVNSLLKLMEKD